MKYGTLSATLTGALAIIVGLSSYSRAQDSATSNGTPRYKLIDLGTFGGPASYFSNGADGILNNRGTAVGWANTTEPDPLCFVPNCIATHGFKFQNGAVSDLGTLAGGNESQALWLSTNGLIVGFSENGEDDPLVPGFRQTRGVLWRRGEIVDLGTLPEGGFESLATGVNNRGQVVGFANNTVPDPFSANGLTTQVRPFLWQNGGMRDLGTLGGPDAIAGAVNEQGEISGPSFTAIDPATGAPGAVHPFFWKNGRMIDVGSLGGTDSEPTGMNQKGEIVGFSTLAGDTVSHPFLWSKGRIIDLGTLGGDTGTTNWINDRGEIAGKADLAGPAPQLHDAVLWRHGKAIDLGVLPGDACSNAYFVNSRGQVVGTSENKFLCSIFVGQRAFLWEGSGPMLDLNTLIAPGAKLHLTYAVAINDRGEIAGFGVPPGCAAKDYEFCGHAYVLIPCGQGENCTNQTLSDAVGADFSPARSSFFNLQLQSTSPGPRLRNSMGRRLHLPGQRIVPSD